MEDKETSLQKKALLESEDSNLFHTSEYDSEKVPKQVHRFYFVKLWPTVPHSISKIKKAERLVEKMNHDHLRICERLKEKMSEVNEVSSRLRHSSYYYDGFRGSGRVMTLNALYVALDELSFAQNVCRKGPKKSSFNEEVNNHKLNFLMLHGTKSLAKEKQILRETSMNQHRDYDPLSTLEELKRIINRNYTTHCYELENEIKQLQREIANGNEASKRKICNIGYWKKVIRDQIKLLSDETLESRRNKIALATKIRHAKKKVEAINKEILSLQKKLQEKYQKKDEAYHRILKCKKMYDESTEYYQCVALMNHVHQLAVKKDIAALDELSCSEVDKFMLAWNNNKAVREDFEKRVEQSLEIRQLSSDGRIKNQKSLSL